MNELVFLEPNCINAIPFTTSDVIAEYAKIGYRSVQRTIEKHQNRLEKFGQVRFEITAVKNSRGTNDKKIYYLNEPQATLLITFLKNTDIVADFKTELVRQFYLMHYELQKRQMNRIQLLPTRRTLTDEIQDNPNHKEWDYKNLTNLAYKMVTGKIAVTLRKERGANPKAIAIDYMTADEIAMVEKVLYKIAVLYEMQLDYHQIKAMLLNRQMIGQIA
jgi:phage regulator Rha-like protein